VLARGWPAVGMDEVEVGLVAGAACSLLVWWVLEAWTAVHCVAWFRVGRHLVCGFRSL
jgi:hypothetical protein